MDNNRILVVDDEPDLTQVSTLALEYHGFKVDSFNDPQEALSKYKPDLYDLVILYGLYCYRDFTCFHHDKNRLRIPSVFHIMSNYHLIVLYVSSISCLRPSSSCVLFAV